MRKKKNNIKLMAFAAIIILAFIDVALNILSIIGWIPGALIKTVTEVIIELISAIIVAYIIFRK